MEDRHGPPPVPEHSNVPAVQPVPAGYSYSPYGYPYGAGTFAPREPHVLDYLRVLHRRRRVVGAVFVLVVLVAASSLYSRVPYYEARVRIEIEQEYPNVTDFKQVTNDQTAWDDMTYGYYPTQHTILTSRLVARRTLDDLKLWNNPELGGGPPRPQPFTLRAALVPVARWVKSSLLAKANSPANRSPRPLDRTARESAIVDAFLGHLTVTPIRRTRVVEVEFQAEDPQLAAMAANGVARAYIEENLDFRFRASKQATAWLDEQLADQRMKLEASEAALQKYREQGDAVALEDRQNFVVQRLGDLNAAHTKARIELIEKESLYRRLEAIKADPAALESIPAITGNTLIQQLKIQITDLQRRRAELSDKYGDKHPEMTKVVLAIQATGGRLRAEIDKVARSTENDYKAAQAQVASLATALDNQKAEALALNRKGIEYGVLRRDVESNKTIYDSLLQRTKETSVMSEMRASNIRVIDAAEVPAAPAGPDAHRTMMLALLAGLIGAAAAGFCVEYLDNRIKLPDEIESHLGTSYLGLVPTVRSRRRRERHAPLLIHRSHTRFGEALRDVRTAVVFAVGGDGSRCLAVTSTLPGEGKTLISTNLAVVLAQANHRVLIVDADMRKPRVHEMLKVAREPGLSEVLTDKVPFDEAIRPTFMPRLFILSAGGDAGNPSELIGSDQFRACLTRAREQYDWVIVDTPPVTGVTDATLVAHAAGAVMLVVGNEMTSRGAAMHAVKRLRTAKARMLGAVLNRVDIEHQAYYYSPYYHRKYVDHYHRQLNG